MDKKKHDIPRIIKTATGAVFAVAAAAVLYVNNHTSLKSAVVLESTSVAYIDGRSESMADDISQSPIVEPPEAISAAQADLININTATSEELQTLSGIGEAKAAAIIAYREEHGIFSDISEIMNVNGIGERIFEDICGSITAGGESISADEISQSPIVEPPTAPSVPEADLININTATSEELQTLSGIGEAKAAAIIAYREEHGIFKDISEIMNVSGIGEKMFEKIRELITV